MTTTTDEPMYDDLVRTHPDIPAILSRRPPTAEQICQRHPAPALAPGRKGGRRGQ